MAHSELPLPAYSLCHPRDSDTFESPACSLSSERILRWPVLHGFAPENINSLLLEPDPRATPFYRNYHAEEPTYSQGGSAPSPRVESSPRKLVIDDSNIRGLVLKYLKITHIKNPILEETRLLQFAADAEEYGLGWDGPSCVVVSSMIWVRENLGTKEG